MIEAQLGKGGSPIDSRKLTSDINNVLDTMVARDFTR